MQIYKTFFRIFRQHRGYVILYLGIFLGVALIISSEDANESGKNNWEAVRYPFAAIDEDQSELSKGLVSCLEGNERIETEYNVEKIMDELYEKNLVCAIRIPKGFGDSVLTGKEAGKIEIMAVRGTVYSATFQMHVTDYIKLIRHYMSDGCQPAEAVGQVQKAAKTKIPVTVEKKENSDLHGRVYYFFMYLPFILVSICVAALGPAVMAFRRQEIRHRNQCSACPESRINMEIVAASVTIGFVLCFLYFLLVLLGTGEEVLSFKGLLYAINMVSFLPVALGITFLVVQVVKGHSALMMAANVIGLGMSCLGGVFGSVEYLGKDLAKAAHLLPAYWYILGNNRIDDYMAGDCLDELWQCMGVEILYGIALVCAGLAFARSKAQTKTI